MNCTEHPDMVVETSCDVCHKPFCPSCLQDDRGRFVCKQCFDPSNHPGELVDHTPDLPAVLDEQDIAREEAWVAFWYSKTGVVIMWVIIGLLTVASIVSVYYDVVYPRYDEKFRRVIELIVDITRLPILLVAFYLLRHPSLLRQKHDSKPLPIPTLILALSPGILLVIYFWWQVFRI